MTLRRQLRWRALAPALGLATCIVGAGFDAARAQGLTPIGAGELIYEKRLDPRLNPARADEVDEVTPPEAVGQEEPFTEKSLALHAIVPEYNGGETPPTRGPRVVYGKKAKKGDWPTAVFLMTKDEVKGGSLCGGTVIDSTWVLTAAHCVFNPRAGGLRALRAATAYTKNNIRPEPKVKFRGEVLRIKRVVVHPEYRWSAQPGLLNDIALLELERATTAERQKLTAQAGQSTFLAPGAKATIIGWGITKPVHPTANPSEEPLKYPASKTLLWQHVPIASQQACVGFVRRQAAAEFCAGDFKGGPDSCNGDSGGPLFVAGHAGEGIQAGIVSWGPGCAHPGTYGVYAAVSHFEPWIRRYVPNAVFAIPRPTAPVLATIAGHEPSGPPALHGQVAVDLAIRPCQTTKVAIPPQTFVSTNRIKAGSCVAVRVTSAVTGHLLVYQRNAKGETWPIFPNKISSGRKRQVGATPTSVRAGEVITIPEDWDGFDFKVSPPFGRAEVIALVVPEGVSLTGIAKQFESGRSIPDMENELDAIARQVNAVPRARRAVGTRQYAVIE